MKQFEISNNKTYHNYRPIDPTIDAYLKEIEKIPMVTPEEEVALVQRIKNKDHVALQELTKANLRFVFSVAKQYQNQGLPLGDLINEGNLGLIEAAKRFDETRGFKFISYAVWWIRQSIISAIQQNSRIVRRPENIIILRNKINDWVWSFEQKYERYPSHDELMTDCVEVVVKDTKKTRGEVERAVEEWVNGPKHLSLDAPVGDEDGSNFIDFETSNLPAPDSNLAHDKSLSQEVEVLLASMPERLADVLRLHYGIGQEYPLSNLEDVADKLGITRERARQLREKALTLIRRNKNLSPRLRSFLG